MRAADRAALATALRGEGDGWPYPSLVQVALDLDGTPLLLLSTLADHTKNIAADPRVGLLFDGTAGLAQPLAGARVSVLGQAEPSDEPRHRARFLARHPAAAFYAGFGDFGIYKVCVRRAHLVAGFGRVRWLERNELLPGDVPAALAEAESDILAHMNTDHAEAVRLCATVLAGRSGGPVQEEAQEGWTMTGIDPDGIDLRCGGSVTRVDFDQRVEDAEAARIALAGLARRARQSVSVQGAAYRALDSRE
ncbi:HugZ family pyridoxamine 5'-phosphate oxidase [Azospirillum sp. sgz302134]